MITNLQPLINFPLIIYLGMGIEPPSPYESLCQHTKGEMGCTIMCDGWTGPTKLSIINFMVYSKGSTIFLKSVDGSNKIKDNNTYMVC